MNKYTTTLIQPFEVLRFGLIDSHTDTLRFCNIIATEEEHLFNECFGSDFYSDMLSDLQSYTYTEYEFGTSYSVGDYVLHEAVIYECIQNTSGNETVFDSAFFVEAPKFSNTEYQYIWNRYLSKILSWTITSNQTIYTSVQDTKQGIVRRKGDDFDPAKISEISIIKKEYQSDIRKTINNMEAYILSNKDNSAFANYKAIQDECSKGCQAKNNGFFGFNVGNYE